MEIDVLQDGIIIFGRILYKNDTIFSIENLQYCGDCGEISMHFTEMMESKLTLSADVLNLTQQLLKTILKPAGGHNSPAKPVQYIRFMNPSIIVDDSHAFTIKAEVQLNQLSDLFKYSTPVHPFTDMALPLQNLSHYLRQTRGHNTARAAGCMADRIDEFLLCNAASFSAINNPVQ